MTGDALLRVLATLASPHRMRVVAALAEERNYVSRLRSQERASLGPDPRLLLKEEPLRGAVPGFLLSAEAGGLGRIVASLT
jgi:hypothetical protein